MNRGRSSSSFLFKFLLAVMFLFLLPLLPSEAPEFIAHTILADIWGVLHLLIIGIALPYGLFCRRRSEIENEFEFHSKTENSQGHIPILHHASSIFEEVLCVSDERSEIQAWDFPYYRTETMSMLEEENCGFDHRPLRLPIRSLRSQVKDSDTEEYVSENESNYDSDSQNVDETVNGTEVTFSPLLRKLRTNRMDFGEFGNVFCPSGNESHILKSESFKQQESESLQYDEPMSSLPNGSSPLCSCSTESPSMKMENTWSDKGFRVTSSPTLSYHINDLDLTKTEDNLKEKVVTSSPIPWKSRSKRMDFREFGNPSLPSENCVPNLLKSKSFRQQKRGSSLNNKSLSAENKPMSSLPNGFSPLSSCLPESPTMEMGYSWSKNSCHVTSSPTSPSLATQVSNLDSTNMDVNLKEDAITSSPLHEKSRSKTMDFKEFDGVSVPRENCEPELLKSRSMLDGFSPLGSSLPNSPSMKIENSWTESHFRLPSSPTVPSNPTQVNDLDSTIEYKRPSESPINRASNANNLISSVESSSGVLAYVSLSNKDGQEPLSTMETSKSLSRSSHSRRFSCASFFDRDPRKSLKDSSGESSGKIREEFASGGKCGWDCLKLDVKPTVGKALFKGKSVRTIRAREIPTETSNVRKLNEKQKNGGKEKTQEEVRNNGEKTELVIISIGISEKNDQSNSKCSKRHLSGSEKDKDRRVSYSEKSSNEAAAAAMIDEDGNGNDEIDKKAGEFIAKFKEQIRLQKTDLKTRIK